MPGSTPDDSGLPGGSTVAPRVTVYVRTGCHLCEVAVEVIDRVCADLGEGFEAIDIDSDGALLAAYTDEIPVTLVDGRRHDFWRVDEQRLRAALLASRR